MLFRSGEANNERCPRREGGYSALRKEAGLGLLLAVSPPRAKKKKKKQQKKKKKGREERQILTDVHEWSGGIVRCGKRRGSAYFSRFPPTGQQQKKKSNKKKKKKKKKREKTKKKNIAARVQKNQDKRKRGQ